MFSLSVLFFWHVSTLRESLQGGAAELSVVQPFRRALDIFHQKSPQEGHSAGKRVREMGTHALVCLVKRPRLSLHVMSVVDSLLELYNLKGTHL